MQPAPDAAPLAAKLRDVAETFNTPIRFVHEGIKHWFNNRLILRQLELDVKLAPKLVLVLSAPKTASTSVLRAALEAKGPFAVARTHHAQPEALWPGAGASLVTEHGGMRHRCFGDTIMLPFLRKFDGELRVISMVRDPIAFNVSNFTYFGRMYWLRHQWRSALWLSEEQLADLFFRNFPHASSSVWWRREFAQTVGYDPLTQPFDTECGWAISRSGRTSSLIMRTDVTDERKTALLQEFLDCPSVPAVRRENSNTGKAPSQLGERLRLAIAKRPDYVDRMLDLPAVRHFWNDAQRARMRASWLRADGPERLAPRASATQG
jgi:hypothetical protein